MKLKNIIYSALVGVGALAMTSCNDFLDKMPDNRVELNSVEQLRLLLCSSYPQSCYAIPCEFGTDNMEDNNTPDEDGNRNNLSAYNGVADDDRFMWGEGKYDSGNDSGDNMWANFYNAIAGANAVLEKIDEWKADPAKMATLKDANKIDAIRGEALLIRAYSHFTLAQVFCEQYRGPELSKDIQGLPYATKPEITVKPHYDRGNLADFYDKVEADLLEGLPLIDEVIYEVPRYHFNAQAANAFAARFYLNKREYDKVLKYCNDCFGGPDVDPTQYCTDIWKKAGDLYYLSDMGKYMNSVEKPRNFLLIPTYSGALRWFTDGNRYACTRDARRATIQGPSPCWAVYKLQGGGMMNPCFNGLCGVNGKSEWGSVYAGNLSEQFEYTDKNAGIGYAHQTVFPFWGEETLLMRAEAKLFLGDQEGCLHDLDLWEKSKHGSPSHLSWGDRYKTITVDGARKFYVDNAGTYLDKNKKGEDIRRDAGIAKPIHIDEVYPCQYSCGDDNFMGLLQCIQHFRRVETVHTGFRWFDIKRYGIEITHKQWVNGAVKEETLGLFDHRRAIQIPAEPQAGGMEPTIRGGADTQYLRPHFEYPAE